MAYEPTTWKNREVERPRTFRLVNNTDSTTTLIPAEGQISEPGTPIVAVNMNKIENQLVTLDIDSIDFTKHVPYANAVSSNGTTYTTTVNGATQYIEGMALSVKIGRQNSGAATINVNSLGAKQIIKANGSALSSGNLKLNSIYTLRYNGTNFILQGEGGEGTAVESLVLNGMTFTNDAGTFTGTMPNRNNTTTTASRIASGAGYIDIIPATGFYDGTTPSRARITDTFFNAANIKSGVTMFGLTGNATGLFSYSTAQLTINSAQANYKSDIAFSFNAGFVPKQFGFVLSGVATGGGSYRTGLFAFFPEGVGTSGFMASGSMFNNANAIILLGMTNISGAASYVSGNWVYIRAGISSQYGIDYQTTGITAFAWG